MQEVSKIQYQLSLDSQKSPENFLFVKVETFEKELKLPFERADKRYFPLDPKTNKGLISEVSMEHGVLSLTLRSILKIFNHFTIPVDIYYMTEKSNNLAFIFNIQPGQSRNLPYKAVYTTTGQLFFSVKSYSVTSVPFVWRDLNSNVTISKTLMCRPKDHLNHTEPFLLYVSGKMKQVYSETSTRYTMASVCYNVYLKPVVVFKNYLPFNVVCIIDKLVEEYVIEPGAYTQLPNVQPGTSSICVKIPDYLEKEWTCKNELLQNPSEFTVWQFSSYENIVKVNLDLGMHCKQDGSSMIMSLYCPFWLNNKTGLTLDYRKSKKEKSEKGSPSKTTEDNMNVITHPSNYDGPILFSFNAKNFFGKKKASIRVDSGDWSDKFPLDVAGSSGYVVCKGQNHIYMIGVRNTLTYNGLTKQVTFTPYYVMVNNAKYDIECREFDRPADRWFTVPAKSCVPFWPRSEKDDKLLKLRVVNTEETTPPFLITQTNNILLQLDNKYGGIHADIQLTESSTYINLSPYAEGLPPPMILNHTDKTISYWEKETVQIRKLDPGHSVLFTWSNPPGCRVLAWDIGNKKEMQDELQTDGLKEFSPMPNYTVYWVSFLNGMQRVILFTLNEDVAADVQSAKQFEVADTEINVSIHGIGLSLVNNVARQELMYLAIANSGIIWEYAKLKSNRYIEMAVRDSYLMERAYQRYLSKEKCDTPDFGRELVDEKTEVDFDTLRMLKPQQRKMRRVFQYGLWIQMKTSPYQLQFHAKVNKVQIDNQLFDCIFPIVLAPVPPPRTMGDNFHRPFIEMSVVQRVMKYSHITQFKYFKVLIQEFHVKVDIGFVIALLDLLETNVANEEEERKHFLESIKLTKEPLKSLVVTISQKEQKSFYDVLHFSPLKIHVSFSLQSGNYKGLSQLDVVNVLLQGLGVTLTDMQDVIFKLAYFERNYTFLSQNQLISEVTSHYSNQAIKQLYVLVLGLDVLGNPYGLVLGITKGFEDFFYEPIQGAIQGPGEFAEGLVLGARSLFSHTVGGAAGAVSRITGAMGKGIAALTFDKDYQRRRRDAMTKKPASVQEGLARGGKGLVMGVYDGVTGVFTKPISGAKHDGVEGFFKGLGKGAIGLITRPTAGVIDFASGSLEAVRRATDLEEDICRIRPSRSLPADGFVRPYNIQEAEGNKILMELEKGKYSTTDVYVAHFTIEKNQVLLLTDKRIALASHSEVFGGWQAEWAFAWSDIPSSATVHPKGVQIPIPEAKKKKFGMFGSNGANKLINVQNDALKEKIVKQIEYMREKA
ncbi:vacuolar protein sorting-associated protein 13 isoform X2 [Agrilus planipennis]|uniref:Vacuolar protein sorting-associated protein 13 isoform X2 n=1 Tax=Agrilus planipennis TaxID=224129 RepID=A0A7F5RFG9_AGRPL|nr:vacuolar protein sorting-associated protein 13 isoform X2 [Agrilus planipennis]